MYPHFSSSTAQYRRKRRDIVNTNKTEDVTVRVDHVTYNKETCLYFETIGFFSLERFKAVFGDNCSHFPEDIRQCIKKYGCLTVFLGRYFSPHQTSTRRDAQRRPVCPGHLSLNHCLWKYAVTNRCRRMLVDRNGNPSHAFKTQSHIFGSSKKKRSKVFEDEKNAYLCIHLSCDINGHVNMTREFDTNDLSLSLSDTWLETVTVL